MRYIALEERKLRLSPCATLGPGELGASLWMMKVSFGPTVGDWRTWPVSPPVERNCRELSS